MDAEEFGLELHEKSGGVRPELEAINSRHGQILLGLYFDLLTK